MKYWVSPSHNSPAVYHTSKDCSHGEVVEWDKEKVERYNLRQCSTCAGQTIPEKLREQ